MAANGGFVYCDIIVSLKPIILTSSGTFMFRSYNPLITPLAIASLAVKNAVGILPLLSI